MHFPLTITSIGIIIAIVINSIITFILLSVDCQHQKKIGSMSFKFLEVFLRILEFPSVCIISFSPIVLPTHMCGCWDLYYFFFSNCLAKAHVGLVRATIQSSSILPFSHSEYRDGRGTFFLFSSPTKRQWKDKDKHKTLSFRVSRRKRGSSFLFSSPTKRQWKDRDKTRSEYQNILSMFISFSFGTLQTFPFSGNFLGFSFPANISPSLSFRVSGGKQIEPTRTRQYSHTNKSLFLSCLNNNTNKYNISSLLGF